MSREEVQKLLGGYATGTLTAEEQQALFDAALEDQELFDTLAREQGLRDLLRDPSAKSELLAALDERPPRGILAWLRRPMVAGLAMAGVAAIAVVVWQGSRKPEQRVLIADNKRVDAPQPSQPAPQSAPQPAPQTTPQPVTPVAPETSPAATAPAPVVPASPLKAVPAERESARTLTQRQHEVSTEALRRKDLKQEIKVPVTAAAPAPAAPAQPKPAELKSVQQAQSNIQVQNAPPSPVNQAMQNQMNSVNVQGQRTENARALFYGPQSSINGQAFADSLELSAGAGGDRKAQKKAAQRGAVAGALAPGGVVGGVAGAPVAHLGVRCSIVRDGNREVDLSTPLYAGESVKLRLTPNADGMLYVSEGEGAATRVVASGAAHRMQAFETPALKSDTPGQRQFHVTLTRAAMEKSAIPVFGAFSRANLVETKSDDKESATYVVQGDGAPGSQQVVVPVTLTWR